VVSWKSKTSLEDTLDVFPCHGVGGAVGMIMTALFAHQAVNSANTTGNGLVFGDTALFIVHLKALAIVVAFTFIGAMILLKVTDLIFGLSVSPEEKKVGSDYSQHGENLYPMDFSSVKEKVI
jgi:Amt family ammonium transporter